MRTVTIQISDTTEAFFDGWRGSSESLSSLEDAIESYFRKEIDSQCSDGPNNSADLIGMAFIGFCMQKESLR